MGGLCDLLVLISGESHTLVPSPHYPQEPIGVRFEYWVTVCDPGYS